MLTIKQIRSVARAKTDRAFINLSSRSPFVSRAGGLWAPGSGSIVFAEAPDRALVDWAMGHGYGFIKDGAVERVWDLNIAEGHEVYPVEVAWNEKETLKCVRLSGPKDVYVDATYLLACAKAGRRAERFYLTPRGGIVARDHHGRAVAMFMPLQITRDQGWDRFVREEDT